MSLDERDAGPGSRPANRRAGGAGHRLPRSSSRKSYRGATTAEIAREAGITEPILYRHFGSKRDLYLACLDEAWRQFREFSEEAIDEEPARLPRARSPTPTWRSARSSAWSTSGSRR